MAPESKINNTQLIGSLKINSILTLKKCNVCCILTYKVYIQCVPTCVYLDGLNLQIVFHIHYIGMADHLCGKYEYVTGGYCTDWTFYHNNCNHMEVCPNVVPKIKSKKLNIFYNPPKQNIVIENIRNFIQTRKMFLL